MQGMYGFPLTEAGRGQRDIFSYRSPYIQSRELMECWYVAGAGGGGFTTLTMAANDFYAVPFIVGRDSVVDKISIRVTTASNAATSATGYWGLFDSEDEADYPGRLLCWASASIKATGVKSGTVCCPLQAGRVYWAFYHAQFVGLTTAWGVLRANTAAGSMASGGIDTGIGAVLGQARYVSQAFDSLRSIAPPGMNWYTTQGTPTIAMRMCA